MKNLKTDYGAIGDGLVDDTMAIQAALDVGGDIYSPDGIFLVSGSLRYRSNTFLHGAGRGSTIFKLKGGSVLADSHAIFEPDGFGTTPPASGYYGGNVTLRDFTVDGNADQNTGVYECIVMAAWRDGLIENIEVYSAREAGINASDDISDIYDVHPVQVVNCSGRRCLADGFQFGNIRARGCSAELNGGAGVRVVSHLSDSLKPQHAILSDMIATRNSVGFLLETQYGLPALPVMLTEFFADRNINGGVSAQLGGSTISGGVVSHNGVYGIRISGEDIKVIGNTFKNNYGSGIDIWDTRHNLQVIGNRCFDDQVSKTQAFGIGAAVWGPGTVDKNIYSLNSLRGNANAGIQSQILNDANNILANNVI